MRGNPDEEMLPMILKNFGKAPNNMIVKTSVTVRVIRLFKLRMFSNITETNEKQTKPANKPKTEQHLKQATRTMFLQ